MRSRPLVHEFQRAAALDEALHIIPGEFSSYLRCRGYAPTTIVLYAGYLRAAAKALAARRRSLLTLSCAEVLPLVARLNSRPGGPRSRTTCRAALHRWVSFRGEDPKGGSACPVAGWQSWIDEYDRFLDSDRGLTPATRLYRRRYARCFLRSMFRSGVARWPRVSPTAIWRFSEQFSRTLKPASANVMLFSLKSFLRFVHLRGACPDALVHAVPHFANYGQATRTQALSEEQRQQLLAAFPGDDARGLRDHAIINCLLELGLRGQEVASLKSGDIDWRRCCLNVPVVKGARSRELPLPRHVASVLRAYIDRGRPGSPSEQLFLRHRSLAGQPFTLSGLRQMIRRAYHRCGFPARWTGIHRLRHSFATRLFRHGADPKQIADLLGHRDLGSTDTYVQADLTTLRTLIRPWPFQHG